MTPVRAAIVLHVGMGLVWALATLTTAITRRVGRPWPAILLGAAGLNMAAGIYLWHALHSGPWGPREHLLVTGTFCAFLALGVQLPVLLAGERRDRRLEGAALPLFRLTLLFILAAATLMIGSRLT